MRPTSIACSYSEPQLAIGSADGGCRVVSLPDGKLLTTLVKPKPTPVAAVDYQPTQKPMVLVSDKDHHSMYDIGAEKLLSEWAISSQLQGNVAFSFSAPQTFVTVDQDSLINVYDSRKLKIGMQTAQTSDPLRAIDIHPNGTEIAVLTPTTILKLDLRNFSVPSIKIPTTLKTKGTTALRYQQTNFPQASHVYKDPVPSQPTKKEQSYVYKKPSIPKAWERPATSSNQQIDTEFPSLGS